MEELAKSIAGIIKDYRNDGGIEIDSKHVIAWVEQFNKDDQQFILEELLHILPKSYLSKSNAIKTIESSLEYMREKYGFSDIKEFLSSTVFLNCQAEHKSQTKLLEFLNDYLVDQFNLNLAECGSRDVKYWVYLDDVLASGGTFRREIIDKINEYGVENFKSDNIKIVCIFFFLHNWGYSNVKYILMQTFGKEITQRFEFHRVTVIENNPRVNYFNNNPSLNNVFPSIATKCNEWDTYLESLEAERQSEFAYRDTKYPIEEKFFSSKENRIRYETILLNKGLEIINKLEHRGAPLRPLGFTSPSYKTFGTGSHAFTWRNISNTCPIVFWWENHGWKPLFSVENRGN